MSFSSMKIVVLCGVALILAGEAGASDIKGKWGIGAGLFNNYGEVSLIQGHSERTAYVFDLSFGGRSSNYLLGEGGPVPSQTEGNSNDWRVNAGPRLRRFTRPSSEFSPYWDVYLATNYGRAHSSGGQRNISTFGVSTGLGFGLEYFTRWHCSAAAHTDVLRIGWTRYHSRSGAAPYVSEYDARDGSASFGISPTLFVRAYF